MASRMCGPLFNITHSARTDIAASVTSAGRATGSGHRLEYLGRPDHRHASGLTRPHDLLLDLGEAFEAHFDGEVTSSDHHTDSLGLHRGEQQLGQVLERVDVLDLQHDADAVGAASLEFRAQPVHVGSFPHERQVDDDRHGAATTGRSWRSWRGEGVERQEVGVGQR